MERNYEWIDRNFSYLDVVRIYGEWLERTEREADCSAQSSMKIAESQQKMKVRTGDQHLR